MQVMQSCDHSDFTLPSGDSLGTLLDKMWVRYMILLLILTIGLPSAISTITEELESRKGDARKARESGDYATAAKIMESLLPDYVKFRGERHIETLEVKELLYLYQMANYDYLHALAGLILLVFQFQDVFGPYHHRTLEIQLHEAACYANLELFSDAEEKLGTLLDFRIKLNGGKHVDTLKVRHWIAKTFLLKKEYATALEKYEQVVQDCEEIFGPNHSDTLAAKRQLASCLLHLKEFDKALKSFRGLVEIQRELNGEKHPDTIKAKASVALVYEHSEKWGECVEGYENVVKEYEEVVGASNPETVHAKTTLSICYFRLGEFEEAKEILEALLKVDGAEEKNIQLFLMVRKWLIATFLKMGLSEKAKEIFKNGLAIAAETFGAESIQVLDFRFVYATDLMEAEDWEGAKKELQTVLEIELKTYDEDAPELEEVKNMLEETMLAIANKTRDEL